MLLDLFEDIRMDPRGNAFLDWFGQSQVVNPDGSPKRVYHGTIGDFTHFVNMRKTWDGNKTFFFTDEPEIAQTYAGYLMDDDDDEPFFPGGNIIPVYLRIENPLVIDAKGRNWKNIIHRGIKKTIRSVAGFAYMNGYDGLIVHNVHDPARNNFSDRLSTIYVVFDPNQIKSVHSKSFDKTVPHMSESSMLAESNARVVYHGFKNHHHAEKALELDALLGFGAQRYWPDGKRRFDDEPDYKNSPWLRGISTTRNRDFAQAWGLILVLGLDLNRIRHKYKVFPYNWGFSMRSQPTHKSEFEEFIITGRSPAIVDVPIHDEDFTVDDFMNNPVGAITDLHKYLTGIWVSSYTERNYPEMIELIQNDPRYKKLYRGTYQGVA